MNYTKLQTRFLLFFLLERKSWRQTLWRAYSCRHSSPNFLAFAWTAVFSHSASTRYSFLHFHTSGAHPMGEKWWVLSPMSFSSKLGLLAMLIYFLPEEKISWLKWVLNQGPLDPKSYTLPLHHGSVICIRRWRKLVSLWSGHKILINKYTIYYILSSSSRHDFCISYSSASESGSDAVSCCSSPDCIHWWYLTIIKTQFMKDIQVWTWIL